MYKLRGENAEDEVRIGSENVNDDNKNSGDDDTDYVGSEDELDNFSDTEYEYNDEIHDLDWTRVLPSDNLDDKVNNSNVEDDSNMLHTPLVSGDDDEEHEKFPAYKHGEVFKFQLGMMFNNKDMVKDALKEYAMEMKKKFALKKNDANRMVASSK